MQSTRWFRAIGIPILALAGVVAPAFAEPITHYSAAMAGGELGYFEGPNVVSPPQSPSYHYNASSAQATSLALAFEGSTAYSQASADLSAGTIKLFSSLSVVGSGSGLGGRSYALGELADTFVNSTAGFSAFSVALDGTALVSTVGNTPSSGVSIEFFAFPLGTFDCFANEEACTAPDPLFWFGAYVPAEEFGPAGSTVYRTIQFQAPQAFQWALRLQADIGTDYLTDGQSVTSVLDFSQTAHLTYQTSTPGETYSGSGLFPGTTLQPVPEPSTWIQLGAGLALVVLALRRRQAK